MRGGPRLGDLTGAIVGELFGRLLWRAGGVALAALFGLVALYHLTVAAMLKLEMLYTPIEASLWVGVGYAVVALGIVVTIWATRRKRTAQREQITGFLNAPGNAQMAMLLEAAMVGFMAGKKSPIP
jgi:cytochrome b